jgi:3-oxoacyl-[acyl-carrier protein] reductase
MYDNGDHGSPHSKGAILVFGARGSLGTAIRGAVAETGVRSLGVTRAEIPNDLGPGWLTSCNPEWAESIPPQSVSGAVWAGGANCANDLSAGSGAFLDMYEANVTYVVDTLAALLNAGCLAENASLVVLGSVWQGLARDRKSAYITSKAAVSGFVRAASVDLGVRGIRINAVLPGVVDTPMTRENLRKEQIDAVVAGTPLGRLVDAGEVANATLWLLGPGSSGVTGACVPVDGGWSYSHAL